MSATKRLLHALSIAYTTRGTKTAADATASKHGVHILSKVVAAIYTKKYITDELQPLWGSSLFFQPFTMTPVGWGHSLLMGRVKYLLKWTFEDLSYEQCSSVIRYLSTQLAFPDVDRFGHSYGNVKQLILVDGLEAYEVASVMTIIIFALACMQLPLSRGTILQSWRLQNVLAVDYYRKGFSKDQIDAHSTHNKFYMSAVQSAFLDRHPDRNTANKVKFHDPEHDTATIQRYGNFRIINELAKESVHQRPKQSKHNNRDVERQRLEKVKGCSLQKTNHSYLGIGVRVPPLSCKDRRSTRLHLPTFEKLQFPRYEG